MTPFIVTFYSYKGGVGRSLLAANIGVLTARRGKTLLWDLDIEAPGLHNIPGLTPSKPVKEGFFEWMIAWQESGKASNKADFGKLVKLACQTPEQDRLFILPAYGDHKDFAGLFQSIRWDDFLVRDLDSGLALFRGILDAFGKAGFETVLLDSRTGITDIGGLLAALLPHATVLVGNYGRQNTRGLAHVWQALYPASEGRIAVRGTLPPLTRLLVASPIADELDLRAKGEDIWKEAFGLAPAELVTIPFDQRLLYTEELYAATRPDTPVAKAYNDLERRIDKVRQQVIAENESARSNKDSRAQGKSFEVRVAHLLRLLGYTVEHEQLIDSNQVDLVVRKRADFGREEVYLVECKDHQAVIPKEIVQVFKTWLDGPTAREMQARGMVVAPSDFSPAARSFALEQGIQALTFDELERSLFDFAPYLARIRQRYEASALAGNYVDQYLLLEKQPDEKSVPMLPHALQWVSGAGSRLWLVLGDYGTGKSTLVERFAYELALNCKNDPESPIPVEINLRQFPNAISLDSLIREHLETELRTVLNPEIVLYLLDAGRVVLLLDSFDEMGVAQVGRSVEEQFRQLVRPTANPGRNHRCNRVLITSRSHFFSDSSSARQAEGARLFEADSALCKAARAFDATLDTLPVFTKEQITEYLHKRLGMVEGDEVRRFIEERYGLQDIASTPRFLNILVASLPDLIKEGENVSTGSLYLTYTTHCLNTIRLGQGKLNVELMRDLLERVACELWSRPQNQIHYTDIAGLLRREGGVALSFDSEQVDLELHTAAFLVRSADGHYRFSHRSFLEFFFAHALFRALQKGHFAEALTYGPVNPAATTFLLDLTESVPENSDKLTEVIRTIFANPYNEGTSEFKRFLNLMPNKTSTTPLYFKGVMVSSTFTDLKEHRAALINIIDRSGFKAVVMEHDSARSDVDVIDSSLRMVQESAAYILVISHKYGQTPVCTSRNPGKLSITELEFNEA
ncbi:MAG: KGGVGR-motif variant AAA ATPase, partial [Chlorobium sp.]